MGIGGKIPIKTPQQNTPSQPPNFSSGKPASTPPPRPSEADRYASLYARWGAPSVGRPVLPDAAAPPPRMPATHFGSIFEGLTGGAPVAAPPPDAGAGETPTIPAGAMPFLPAPPEATFGDVVTPPASGGGGGGGYATGSKSLYDQVYDRLRQELVASQPSTPGYYVDSNGRVWSSRSAYQRDWLNSMSDGY